MADKKIFIADGPKKGKVPRAPFDLTFTSNITAKFGKVQCAMLKYYPAGSKLRIRPHFVYDMMPYVYPIQTNVRCHVKLYKIPLRILCKDFEDFTCQLGQDGTPVNSGSFPFVLPYIKRPSGWNSKGSLAEQIGASNITLESQSRADSLVLTKYIGSFNQSHAFLRSDSFSSSNLLAIVRYPNDSLPEMNPLVYSTLSNGCFAKLSYINSQNTPGSPVGGVRVHLLKLINTEDFTGRQYTDNFFGNPNSALYSVYSSDLITTSKSSTSILNSSTTSAWCAAGNTPITLNDDTFYRHEFYLKLVDDDFYLNCEKYRAAGFPVMVGLEFTGDLRTLFAPVGSDTNSDIQFQSLSIPVPTDYNPQTNKITTISSKQYLLFSSGLATSGVFAMLQYYNGTHTYYDSVNGADPVQPIPAMPFRALEFIHNYFMRKPRIDPFMKDGVPSYNKFITNDGSGADETTPVESWNALLEDDYFTTCVKEPQFGNAPLVGVTVNDTSDTGILTFADDGNFNNYTVKLDIDQDGHVLPLTAYSDNADRPNVHRLQELINFGISINDLRNVSTFQRMLERMQRSVTAGGSAYANYMYEFFGTNPPIGDHYPQYLGGITRNLQVSKITNVAKSEQAALGEFAGQGRFEGKGKWIKCFLTEPSYIVAIQYFTITPTYSQYTPKHLFYNDPLDFYLNPDFATIAPQPVYKKEVAIGALEPNQLDDVFGYNRPYAELVSNVDEVHGEFRDTMANFLLQRMFGKGQVNLNKSFIEVDPAQYLNIFSVVENTDKIYGQCMFEISGSLPLPRSYTPHTI